MKVFLSSCVVALCLTLASGTLLDTLKAVHASPAFKNLTHQEQVLVIELVAEVEAGELHNYIDIVGFDKILALLDSLPETEANVLTTMLMQELQLEEHHFTNPAVGKRSVASRSLAETLSAARHDPAFQNLTSDQQQFVIDTLRAAESMQLTAYVQKVGYGAVLQIVDIIPEPEKHMFETYLIQHLQQEAAAAHH